VGRGTGSRGQDRRGTGREGTGREGDRDGRAEFGNKWIKLKAQQKADSKTGHVI